MDGGRLGADADVEVTVADEIRIVSVGIRCQCGDTNQWVGPKLDLASVLRSALARGWRGVDDEVVDTAWNGTASIGLTGLCRRCVAAEMAARKDLAR